MNIFVTGGAGYIGSICVESLLDQGHSVTVFDNLSEGHLEAVDPRAKLVVGDLENRDLIAQSLRGSNAEAIFHFAASALVGESMVNPTRYFRNNVGSGINLLEAAQLSGIKKFIFSSTCATFGVPESIPLLEDAPQRPVNPYGESKLMMERMLAWHREIHGLEYVAFRYFNAAGATERLGEHHRIETHLIPNVLKVALGQAKECQIFGTDYPTPDGTCIRDYLHISDIAQAHILALKPGISGAFNLGNGSGFSVREVIHSCAAISGRAIPAIEKSRRPGDPPRLITSAAKAQRELGWKPKYPHLDQIIETAWKWHLRHPNGYSK